MSKLTITAMAVGLVIATSSFGFAAPGNSGSSRGNSGSTPGHMMQQNGPVAGHPGASGYAPGHLKKKTVRVQKRKHVVRSYGYAR